MVHSSWEIPHAVLDDRDDRLTASRPQPSHRPGIGEYRRLDVAGFVGCDIIIGVIHVASCGLHCATHEREFVFPTVAAWVQFRWPEQIVEPSPRLVNR